jgi:transposase
VPRAVGGRCQPGTRGPAQRLAEKVSTDIARRFDVIRVEDLQITNMTRSAKGTRENPGRNVRQKASGGEDVKASTELAGR